MQSKHAWERALSDTSWDNVKKLIDFTMRKGTITLINQRDDVMIYEVVHEDVVVRYAIVEGIVKISDAWIKTR